MLIIKRSAAFMPKRREVNKLDESWDVEVRGIEPYRQWRYFCNVLHILFIRGRPLFIFAEWIRYPSPPH